MTGLQYTMGRGFEESIRYEGGPHAGNGRNMEHDDSTRMTTNGTSMGLAILLKWGRGGERDHWRGRQMFICEDQ